jgi:hypothetical protein
MQADFVDDKALHIRFKAGRKRAVTSCCGAQSVRQLAPGQNFDDDLIDVVLGLMESSEALRIVYLGAKFYTEIKKEDFGESNRWVQNVARENHSWLLPICDENRWMAFCIDWTHQEIRYYDPTLGANGETGREGIVKVRRQPQVKFRGEMLTRTEAPRMDYIHLWPARSATSACETGRSDARRH